MDLALAGPFSSGVGRLVPKLKRLRRVATRYDQTAASFLAFVKPAALRIRSRHVHTT